MFMCAFEVLAIFSLLFFLLNSPLLKYLGKVEHNNTCESYKHSEYKMPDRREYITCVLIYTYLYRCLKQAKLIHGVRGSYWKGVLVRFWGAGMSSFWIYVHLMNIH